MTHRFFFGTVFLMSLAASGCDAEMVEIQGIVTLDSPLTGLPAPGVEVEVFDGSGNSVDSVLTNQEGVFRAGAPSGQSVHLFVTDEDGYTSSFRGVAGMNPRTAVPAGFAHTFGADVQAGWKDLFSDCDGVDSGAFTIGQIQVDLFDDTTGERPVAHAASVDVFAMDGTLLAEGCYLNDEGTSTDLTATQVGDTGLFGVFGLEPGSVILRVETNLVEGQLHLYEYDLLLPDGGSAPRFPILVPFEF